MTRSKIFIITIAAILCVSMKVDAQDKYQIKLDLKKVKKDRVKVEINTPTISEDSAVYIMPSVIPGSYSKKDYGRFVHNFTAYNSKGKKLPVIKRGNNLFVISNAKDLQKIKYTVDDTWDVPTDDDYIFQPGGTNIDKGKNFLINHHGFYGYLDRYKMLPYIIEITKPKEMYGATSLVKRAEDSQKEIYMATDYVKLVDAPIMFCKPDTASFQIANTTINISVYSETGAIKAAQVREYVKPLSLALGRFFVKMPVDQYHFLFYFPKYGQGTNNKFGGYGALEHSYSSFYFLPELPEVAAKPMILSVASHEFLHILTPLNIHSEEIGNFDFKDPKMSRHLWMYEGCTEYFANLVQVREGLMEYNDFITEMQEKIKRAARFPDVSFTEMSKNILLDPFKDMYENVYDKGALIGFLLDIRLKELSEGKSGVRELLLKFAEKYGPSKSFRDDELISEIAMATDPSILDFFNDYVIGNKPLPYEEYFKKIGWNYYSEKQDTVTTFGILAFKFDDSSNRIVVFDTDEMSNAFGLKEGDHIVKVNNTTVDSKNYRELLTPLVDVQEEIKPMSIVYARNGQQFESVAEPQRVDVVLKDVVENNTSATEQQLTLRRAVLNK